MWKQRFDVKLKQLDPQSLLHALTVQEQALTRCQQSSKTFANHANCLQKGNELSIEHQQ